MLAGLQTHIKALNAIIPDSFIFILDLTDRSFIYRSCECQNAAQVILDLDRSTGIDSLFSQSQYYSSETEEHSYMIKKLGSHTFLGFLASKRLFPVAKIKHAQEFFLN